MQWHRGEGSSTLPQPLSWERPQGSISQPAITRSQNGTLPPTFKAVAALFNAAHRLLNRDALGAGCSPCCKVTRSNRHMWFSLIVPGVSVSFLKCNEWVWSVALNTGRASGFSTRTNNAKADCLLRCSTQGVIYCGFISC